MVESARNTKVIALFDVDGTLSPARQVISKEMLDFIHELKKKVVIGIVGGSDFVKQQEQLAPAEILSLFDYVFSENGLVAYKNGEKIGEQSLVSHLGEETLKEFINYTLKRIAEIDLPFKRGNFIEFRMGMLNVSPVGRNVNQEERMSFNAYDNIHKIRESLVSELRERFKDTDLAFSIGGQISFDVFPRGWDKTFCLPFLEKDGFAEIHFFGDKTFEGGNDHEIYTDSRTIGHAVTDPQDTQKQCHEIWFK